MKRLLVSLFVPLALAACAVDPSTPDPGEGPGTENAIENVTDEVGDVQSELRLDDSKYCLPGETVKCTLGPPPVCRCVPKPPVVIDIPPVIIR